MPKKKLRRVRRRAQLGYRGDEAVARAAEQSSTRARAGDCDNALDSLIEAIDLVRYYDADSGPASAAENVFRVHCLCSASRQRR